MSFTSAPANAAIRHRPSPAARRAAQRERPSARAAEHDIGEESAVIEMVKKANVGRDFSWAIVAEN